MITETAGKATEKETFLGRDIATISIPGLRPGIGTCTIKGKIRQVLTLSDEAGVKWKLIHPYQFCYDPNNVALFHRSGRWGKKFHSQRQYAWGTKRGLNDLLRYIEEHEKYEAGT